MIAAEEGSLLTAVCAVMPRLVGAYSVVAIVEQRARGLPRPARRAPARARPPRRRRLVRRLGDLRARPDRRPLRARRAPGRGVRVTADGVESRQALPSAGRPAVRVRAHLLRPAGQPDGRHDGVAVARRRWAPSSPARARPRPTSWWACPTAARPRRSASPSESGIPYAEAVVRNRYVGRSFIQPDQTLRQHGIRLKFNPLPAVIARQAAGGGRRLDRARQHHAPDRGDAARRRRHRGAHAHLEPADPVALLLRHRHGRPLRAGGGQPHGRGDRGADRRPLARLPLAARACSAPSAGPPCAFCRACFTGEYPIAIPDSSLKLRFEPGAREPARA